MTADALLEAPTIWALVQGRVRLSGDRPMLLDTEGGRLTFSEVATRAERVAAGLQALGVEPGTTVTWQLPTRIDTVLVSLALARLAAALDMSPDDLGSMAFPYSHIGRPDYLLMMLAAGFGAVLVEAFAPADAVAAYRSLGVTMCGGSTAFYQMFLAEQRKSTEDKA